jgi:hypothetical protein
MFFENLSRKFVFHCNTTRITGILHEDRYTFMIISRSSLLEMRKFSGKTVEKIKTHFGLDKFFFENRTVYEILWKNIVEPNRPQTTIQGKRIAC